MKTIRGKEGDPSLNIRMRTTMKMKEETRKLVRTDEDENAKTEDRRGTLVLVPCRVDTGARVGDENKMGSGHCEPDNQWSQARCSLIKV